MWRAVQILRAVSDELEKFEKSKYPRGELVNVHGNRFILHRVFLDPKVQSFRDLSRSDTDVISASRKAARKIFADCSIVIENLFPNAYLANLFKNAKKCAELDAELQIDPPETAADLWHLKSD
jgi:hypothetical protein